MQRRTLLSTLAAAGATTAAPWAFAQSAATWPDQPLLVSLEQGGIDWPSSCRNGTCRTCLGQLRQGSVRYEIEWPGLSTEEMAEGCVLPCVAYPVSDVELQA